MAMVISSGSDLLFLVDGGSHHPSSPEWVKHLKNHCYSFLVCNKNIGLYVNSIRDFTCKDFHVRFFLWGNGGPNWKREYMLWQKEEADCWTLVTRKKSSVKSRTKNAVWVAKGKSHIDKPSVFKRLFHANGDPFVRQSFQFIGSSSGCLLRSHDEYAAVVIEPQPPAHLVGQLIQEVTNIITNQHHKHVVRVQRYPLALCIVQLPSMLERDILMDRVLGRVLVKARYKSASDVPSRIVLGDTMAYGGTRQTWTFHVYILNGEPPDMFPEDEDLLPIWQMLPPPNQQNQNHHEQNMHNANDADVPINPDIGNEGQDDNHMILDQNQNQGNQAHDSEWEDSPSPIKRRKINLLSSKVARALPFSKSDEQVKINAVQPKVRKAKNKVPVSAENLRRSPRFLGQEKMDLAFDTPKKKTKVQPATRLLTLDPNAQSSKRLPPPIPVKQLHKIGTKQCGLLPEEVTSEKLLKPKK
ncbi:hypothetical protein OsI_19299 [Oryza sativa Indica Group]|uniref:DUF7597 domain-containing protein n=1 Tax=Oryza sativa subsp. indica TaxID=39946 RepID=B8AW36_ORYSI|nr:hypothetical protein OsI_19299 [Oryza sativa Indica Group]